MAGLFAGFAELREPRDLVKKLQFDFERIKNSPQDQYAAFDFFVTAEHIVDWLHPKITQDRISLRASEPLLQITSHIASGAKHFETTDARHKSVSDIHKSHYVEPGYVEDGYVEEPLFITFTDEMAENMKCNKLTAIQLAQLVYEYWSANI
jgi:hypothetical protein